MSLDPVFIKNYADNKLRLHIFNNKWMPVLRYGYFDRCPDTRPIQ